MGKMERDKGNRIEREIINLHKELGVYAERVPLSGASRYQGGGHDVDIYPYGKDHAPFRCEVKGRASGEGFTMLERWLAAYDVLFLRRDRQEPLVVVPWQTWISLLGDGPSTNTQPEPKSGHVDVICAKPAVNGTTKGEPNEYLDESR